MAVLGIALLLSAAAMAGPLEDALRMRVEQIRSGHAARAAGGLVASRKLLPDFYARRGFQPVWTQPTRMRELISLIDASPGHGLDPADYQLAALREALACPCEDPLAKAERDLLFTDALIRLAYHLHFGKANPRDLQDTWNFSRDLGGRDPVDVLESLVASGRLSDMVERLAPQLREYRLLREALAHYRAIESSGGWPILEAGPTLRAGVRDPRVPRLRTRLGSSGDLAMRPVAEPERFDETLAAAVAHFQQHHGLDGDGAVGRRTLVELNVPVGQRIDQIRVNLERLRWVAQDLSGDYLLVDIAGFSARLSLGGSLAWESRAIVGRPYRKTPEFRATLRTIVLNPAWVVPATILKVDLLPKLAQDRSYLARHDMQVVDEAGRAVGADDIDWSRYRTGRFPYQIVQSPGPDNPLGMLKFVFPNPYDVYLHDTPSRKLFEKSARAFSSGCIRLEKPRELAVLLLDDPAQWTAERLDAAIATGQTISLPVKRRVPVMFLYFTAAVEASGELDLRPDLYQRDPAIREALSRPFRFTPVAAMQGHL